jgi:hypothetical protein
MRNFKIFIAILPVLFLLSCAKEYSNESGGGIGKSCRLSNITVVNEQTGAGEYALNTRYDNTGKANYVELYDSVLNGTDIEIGIEYKTSDTLRTSNGDVLVLDANKRLKRLITPLDPTDPAGEKLYFDYKYNSSGYLTEKTLSTSSLPITLFQTIYTWTGGNLTKVESSSNLTGTKQKLLDVDLQYDLSKSPKNFIPIYPDAFESFLYVTSVDMGKPSTNLLKRISAVYYDDQGKPSPAVVSEISQAKFSNDGYLTEWVVDGGSFDALGLFAGKNSFTYKCN